MSAPPHRSVLRGTQPRNIFDAVIAAAWRASRRTEQEGTERERERAELEELPLASVEPLPTEGE